MAASAQGNPSFFPGGFASGLVVKGMPILQTNPGVVWWVSNNATLPSGISSQRIPFVNGSDGNKGTWNAPFATIAKAISFASSGDIIMVKPGHAETITAAAGLVLSQAGVAIVGLGSGSTRPTITFTTANTASITVTANDVSIQNFLFVGGFLNVATAFSIANAQVATGFTVDNCEFRDSSTILGFVSAVKIGTTANIADGFTFTRNKVFCNQTGAPAAQTAVVIASNLDRGVVSNNYVVHGTANNNVALLVAGGALNLTNWAIDSNTTVSPNTGTTAGEMLSSSSTACSGLISNNYSWHLAATGLLTPVSTKFAFAQNFCSITGAADKQATENPLKV